MTPAQACGVPAESQSRALHLMVQRDGWGGLLHVHDDLEADICGVPIPLVRWDLPLFRAEALLEALEVLDKVGELYAADDGEGPNGWDDERRALKEALEHLIHVGRAVIRDGFVALPTTEGAEL
ncbi:MAG: hypothetical protein IE926_16770 [Micrococcales bacterium]|nr:hypothetical protein [Micrococcales bacterium]